MAYLCYCGQRQTKLTTTLTQWLCHQCWEIQTDSVYFACDDTPSCRNLIGDQCMDTCAQCAAMELDFDPSTVDNREQIILNKMRIAANSLSFVTSSTSRIALITNVFYLKLTVKQVADCDNAQVLGQILYNIKSYFKGHWLSNVERTNLGNNEEFDEIKKQYDEMMNAGLRRNRIMIDEEELNLSPNIMEITQSDEFPADSKTKAMYTRLNVKWKCINEGHPITIHTDNRSCSKGVECKAWRRMLCIAEIFNEHCLKSLIGISESAAHAYLDLFRQCLSGYSVVSFLDDLQHIESMHGKEGNALKCENHQSGKECVSFLMRKYRARKRSQRAKERKTNDEMTAFDGWMNGLDDAERAIMEISVKMHDALSHRSDGANDEKEDEDQNGFKVRSLKWSKEREQMDQKNNKFMNEITVKNIESEQTEGGRMDDLKMAMLKLYPGAKARVHADNVAIRSDEISVNVGDYVFIVEEPDSNERILVSGNSERGYVPQKCLRSIFRTDCNRFIQFLIDNQYDSEAVLYDLVDVDGDPCNEYKDSNLFPELNGNHFLAKRVRKQLGANHNDDDELSPFTFGCTEWDYWPAYKSWNTYNKPKYGSLKEECTQNRFYSLSMVQFTNILTKATLYRESQKGRQCKAMDRNAANGDYCIPSNLPITVSHIVVLLMYCNWTELQYLYKKFGCRKMDENQSRDDFKVNNAEIGHWYRLIFESVTFFGTTVSPNNVFYTGLNLKLGFDSFSPLWLCPFSTTTSYDIATRFSKESGIILRLKAAPGSTDKYFNVEWLSDYHDEKERLFTKAYDLQIIDIQYVEGNYWTKNEKYLSAFTLFSTLFNGHYLSIKGRRKTERMLLKLIRNYRLKCGIGEEQEVNEYTPISLYVQQLFYNLLQGFQQKMVKEYAHVIRSEYETLADSLKSELFLIENGTDGATLTFTPFMGTLCKERVIWFLEEYIWVIHDEHFNALLNTQPNHGFYSEEEYQYKNRGWRSPSVSFVFVITRNTGGTNKTAFGVKIRKCSTEKVSGTLSVFVQTNTEETWNGNRYSISSLSDGIYGGFNAFDENLLNTAQSLSIRVAIRFW